MHYKVLPPAFPQDGVGHPVRHKVREAGTELSQGKVSWEKPAPMCFLNKCKAAEGNCCSVLCGCGGFCLLVGCLKPHLPPG